jgi:hypothetical protein
LLVRKINPDGSIPLNLSEDSKTEETKEVEVSDQELKQLLEADVLEEGE